MRKVVMWVGGIILVVAVLSAPAAFGHMLHGAWHGVFTAGHAVGKIITTAVG